VLFMQHFAKVDESLAEQIVFAGEVGIESRSTDVRLVNNVLNRNRVVTFAQNERDQRRSKRLSCSYLPPIH
jgi:predicted RNA-binding protein with EMAP domain